MKNDPKFLVKKRVVEKLKNFFDYVRKNDGKIGTKQRGIELNFNNACNFKCEHCFTDSNIGLFKMVKIKKRAAKNPFLCAY